MNPQHQQTTPGLHVVDGAKTGRELLGSTWFQRRKRIADRIAALNRTCALCQATPGVACVADTGRVRDQPHRVRFEPTAAEMARLQRRRERARVRKALRGGS